MSTTSKRTRHGRGQVVGGWRQAGARSPAARRPRPPRHRQGSASASPPSPRARSLALADQARRGRRDVDSERFGSVQRQSTGIAGDRLPVPPPRPRRRRSRLQWPRPAGAATAAEEKAELATQERRRRCRGGGGGDGAARGGREQHRGLSLRERERGDGKTWGRIVKRLPGLVGQQLLKSLLWFDVGRCYLAICFVLYAEVRSASDYVERLLPEIGCI